MFSISRLSYGVDSEYRPNSNSLRRLNGFPAAITPSPTYMPPPYIPQKIFAASKEFERFLTKPIRSNSPYFTRIEAIMQDPELNLYSYVEKIKTLQKQIGDFNKLSSEVYNSKLTILKLAAAPIDNNDNLKRIIRESHITALTAQLENAQTMQQSFQRSQPLMQIEIKNLRSQVELLLKNECKDQEIPDKAAADYLNVLFV